MQIKFSGISYDSYFNPTENDFITINSANSLNMISQDISLWIVL